MEINQLLNEACLPLDRKESARTIAASTDSRNSLSPILFVVTALAATLFLASCGGSSGGASTQPPVVSYATTTAVYTKGTAITPDTPINSGGAPTSYSITPVLPAGLSLNSTTGALSGTPTVVAAQAVYTVTASNTGGNASIGLRITVNDVFPSGLTYTVNPAVYAVAASISPNVPSWSSVGGTPTSFSAVGGLPFGLSIDPATGIITGSPTAQLPQANYTVTASNSGGSTNATLTITVLPQAPYITTQPASQYVGSDIAANLAVGAGGGGTLSYQWYENSAAISGANYLLYTTPVLTAADSGEQFYVVVSDNYGRSVTSNTATLTIKGVSGTFVNTGTPNVARGFHTSTLLQNGMVLIAGGQNGNNALSSAELYDPVTGNFTFTGSLVTARSAHSATLLQNGKVLIAGGYTFGGNGSSPVLASAEIYDPGTGLFSSTGSLANARTGHSAILLASGKVLIAGGETSSNGFAYSTLASAELYDPVAGTFSSTGSLNTARSAPATLLSNGQVLLAGGGTLSTGLPTSLASAEIYDPSAGTFSFTGSLSTARSGHSATLLQNGKVLIAGGDSGGNPNYLSSAELYDPSAGTFTATGDLNYQRQNHGGVLLPNGQVLIVGGGISFVITTSSIINITEIYDPASGVFIVNAPTNYNRFFFSANLLNNGQVFVTGQETSAIGGGTTDPSELYKP
jgi:uncharacterized repeat protein (TIGR01451 family)